MVTLEVEPFLYSLVLLAIAAYLERYGIKKRWMYVAAAALFGLGIVGTILG